MQEALAGGGTPSFLAADFNEDTAVDGTDLGAWETHYGLTGTASKSQGDANADLNVAGDDFLIWQRQFGQSPPPTMGAIPEPASLLLFTTGTVLLSALRRRLA